VLQVIEQLLAAIDAHQTEISQLKLENSQLRLERSTSQDNNDNRLSIAVPTTPGQSSSAYNSGKSQGTPSADPEMLREMEALRLENQQLRQNSGKMASALKPLVEVTEVELGHLLSHHQLGKYVLQFSKMGGRALAFCSDGSLEAFSADLQQCAIKIQGANLRSLFDLVNGWRSRGVDVAQLQVRLVSQSDVCLSLILLTVFLFQPRVDPDPRTVASPNSSSASALSPIPTSLHPVVPSAHPFLRYWPSRYKHGVIPQDLEPGTRLRVADINPLHRFCTNTVRTGGCWSHDKNPVDARFRLAYVEAVGPDPRAIAALEYACQTNAHRRHGNNAVFNFDSKNYSVEQLRVLDVLRHSFSEREPGTLLREGHFVYCFHGPRIADVDSICKTGLVAVGTQDDGYYGSGMYTTLNIEYAIRYARGDYDDDNNRRPPNPEKRYPVFLMAAAIGMAYPVTPAADYNFVNGEQQRFSKLKGSPLKKGFDCHVVCVDEGNSHAVDRNHCKYVELVIAQQVHILPLAVLWFEER
jgi:regulator of replication initiation timing